MKKESITMQVISILDISYLALIMFDLNEKSNTHIGIQKSSIVMILMKHFMRILNKTKRMI